MANWNEPHNKCKFNKSIVLDLYKKHKSVRKVAGLLNVSITPIRRILTEEGVNIKLHGKGNFTKMGYNYIRLRNHPFSDSRGYIAEHRLLMEKQLGRFLKPEEEVHHFDGNRLNNKINNLYLFEDKSTHLKFHKWLDFNIKILTGGLIRTWQLH